MVSVNSRIVVCLAGKSTEQVVREQLNGKGERLEWHTAPSIDEVDSLLNECNCDLLLVDRSQLGERSREAVHTLRAAAPRTPLVVLSEGCDEETVAALMRAGVDDFITVSNLQSSDELLCRLVGAVRSPYPWEELETRQSMHALQERVKELTCLHRVSRILNATDRPCEGVLNELATIIPAGWQFPEITACRICFDGRVIESPPFRETPWKLQTSYTTELGQSGSVEVVYLQECPPEDEGPFLLEERHLIDTIGEMLCGYLARRRSQMIRSRDAQILDNLQDAVILTDTVGIVTFWNDAATRLFGWSAEEIVGRHYADRFPESEREWLREQIRLRLAGDPWIGEFEDRRKDGSRVWIDSRVTRLVNDRGEAVGIVGVSRDITERKEAEKALRASEERYRDLVETSRELIWSVDVEGTITFMNQAARPTVGYTPEEVVGRNLLEFVVEDDRERCRSTFIDTVRSGTGIVDFECQVACKAGERVTLSSSSRAVRNMAGHVSGVIITSRDVTEQRRAREALRLRDRAIKAVLHGILITDPSQHDNPIVYVNPGFESVTGYSEQEILGRNCRFLQGPETDEQSVALIRRAVEAGEACTVELLNYRKDGMPFWNRLTISPIHDEDGELTHFVGVQMDVTERRMLEDQLRQSKKMEAIGRLAGGIAHDFNNLLTVINGYSELLLEQLPPDDQARPLLAQIREAGSSSAELTRQLLALSRKQVLAKKVINLNDVVSRASSLLGRLIGEDIELVVDPQEDLSPIEADPVQLEQVILNLAVNAREAMPSGGTLTIATRNVVVEKASPYSTTSVEPGEYALLTVSDTGTGMPPEVRERIFEPFFTTKASGHGTGLGMAVVHGIITQSGGHIEVESEVGKGTIFRIMLPHSSQPVDEVARDPQPSQLPRGDETILLVEDEEGVRRLARDVLVSCGYTVVTASNGQEAIAVGTGQPSPIHLLLTDVVLPGEGGRWIAEQFLRLQPDIRVIYISGYTDDAVVRQGISESRVNFLQKPFTAADLTCLVREVLDRKE